MAPDQERGSDHVIGYWTSAGLTAHIWRAAEASQGRAMALSADLLLLTMTRAQRGRPGCRVQACRERIPGSSLGEAMIPKTKKAGPLCRSPPFANSAGFTDRASPRISGVKYLFTSGGNEPISGFSKFKREFDKACGVTGWTLHDLRRTGRSLMSRAGVPSDRF